jgi:hypothetical protein
MKDGLPKTDEEILTCNASDEALEIAGAPASQHGNFTLGACTGLSECPA